MTQRHSELPPFLEKLELISRNMDPDISCWSEDGTSYVVKDNGKFEKEIRNHFRGSLSTFIRQLNFYGFRKFDARSNGYWSFGHPCFVRGKPELLAQIKRKTNTRKKHNATGHDDTKILQEMEGLKHMVYKMKDTINGILDVLNDVGYIRVDNSDDVHNFTKRARDSDEEDPDFPVKIPKPPHKKVRLSKIRTEDSKLPLKPQKEDVPITPEVANTMLGLKSKK